MNYTPILYVKSCSDVEDDNMDAPPPPLPSSYDSYQVCQSLDFSTEELDKAFDLIDG